MAPVANINSADYYQVLGVSRTATDSELTKAYKKLALKHHPDKNQNRRPEAEEEFKKITEAYDALRDPEKRKIYDQFGKDGLQGNVGPGHGGASAGSGMGGGMTQEQAQAMFSQFFGGASGAGSGPRPSSTRLSFTTAGGGPFVMSDDGIDLETLFMGMGVGGSTGGRRSATSGRRRCPVPSREGPYSHHPESRASRTWAMSSGSRVTIHGLSKAKEHNGKTGTVQHFDEERGRYAVQVDAGSLIWARPANLIQRCCVELQGVPGKPELDGQFADILGFDSSSGSYLAETQGHSSILINLKPANCILDAGTCVKLRGLSAVNFNGQIARILENAGAGRYRVGCQNGQQIKVKYESVLC